MSLEREVTRIVGEDWVITGQERELFSYPAFLPLKVTPPLVVLPGSEEEVIEIVKLFKSKRTKYLIRGAGTSLSGSTTPTQGEVVISLNRLNKVFYTQGLEITVGPGIANLHIGKFIDSDVFYAPDPSSYVVSSIGGNISHDSGGMHTPKYGTTFNSVISLRVLLPDGSVEDLNGRNLDPLPLFVGSEGTLGIILRATLRLFPKPGISRTLLAAFDNVEDAGKAVVEIYKVGVTPASLEFMDKPSIIAVENTQYKANYPEAEAILLIELDGNSVQVEEEIRRSKLAISKCNGRFYEPTSEEEKTRWWIGRKGAFPSFAYYSPSYLTLDANVPRSSLPKILEFTYAIGRKYSLPVANCFHAGDGTLHPLIGFNSEDRENTINAIKAAEEITYYALTLGGVPSGEHGIGIEKLKFMPVYYSSEDIEVMRRIKESFDPEFILNPCKLIPPKEKECIAVGEIHKHLMEVD
ncbi:FAD-linked oxidase C-terminal domain-containing protein [Acidianus sp. RZ1]|uniref:FAD-binding oxidoreductase n=1 Tax=Acidianus sp. RZ1 TaxID=1540082 RepID=UPI001490A3AF|nr:FAD-binding protein [Acidianus sp. RZ1]